MKRSRQEIEETIEILSNRIGELPDETILGLAAYLPNEDLLRFCQTDSRFSEFCRRFDLVNKRAIQEIAKITPIPVVLDTPLKQLDAIRRGQRTFYMVHLETANLDADGLPLFNSDLNQDYRFVGGIHHLSLDYEMVHLKNSILVALPGSPPPSGTKLWILGAIVLVAGNDGLRPYDDYPGQWKILNNPNDPTFGWGSSNNDEEDPVSIIASYIEQRSEDALIRGIGRDTDLYKRHKRRVHATIVANLTTFHERMIKGRERRAVIGPVINDPRNQDYLLMILQEVEFP